MSSHSGAKSDVPELPLQATLRLAWRSFSAVRAMGVRSAQGLSRYKGRLTTIFALLVFAVALYMLLRSVSQA